MLIWNCLLLCRICEMSSYSHRQARLTASFDRKYVHLCVCVCEKDSCVFNRKTRQIFRVMNLISVGVNYHDTIIKVWTKNCKLRKNRMTWWIAWTKRDEIGEDSLQITFCIITNRCCRFMYIFQFKKKLKSTTRIHRWPLYACGILHTCNN